MSVERLFLDWNKPLVQNISEYLLPESLTSPVELENKLIIVQTRQAGRRLREALASHCSRYGTALLSTRVETSDFFLNIGNEAQDVASNIEVTAIWCELLSTIDPTEYQGLYPAGIPRQDLSWALHTSETIEQLRRNLVNGGYTIAQVLEEHSYILEEVDRWQDLARLESNYLSRLEELGKRDPCKVRLNNADHPQLPEEISQVILAAIPDPTPLMVRALERLAERIEVIILINADGDFSDRFDTWGRPTRQWSDAIIEIPEEERNIIVSGSLRSQSEEVVNVIAAESDRFGPADIAIGVPDRQLLSSLKRELENNSLTAFDPSGLKLEQHPICQLLDAFKDLIIDGSYKAFSSFIRQSAVLNYLYEQYGVVPYTLLKELDEFQNYFIPVDLQSIIGYLRKKSGDISDGQKFSSLAVAVDFVNEQLHYFEKNEIVIALCSLLQTLYEVKTLSSGNHSDAEFIQAANAVRKSFREFTDSFLGEVELNKNTCMSLLMNEIRNAQYYYERKDAVIDLEGWLELLWNDAPLMIVTGMNDEYIPGGQLSDIFLPDTLRQHLGLRNDADRLAANAYIMQALIKPRIESGRISFIAGKTDALGNPLRPSRLFFKCRDQELPERAGKLFANLQEERGNYPPTTSFLLRANLPQDISSKQLIMTSMSATKFKDYLACPFRFYLKYLLGMNELSDEKMEMDARDFGSLVHDVINNLFKDRYYYKNRKEKELIAYLDRGLDNWIERRFGRTLPLQLEFQRVSAKQRLRAAVYVQLELWEQGWEIVETELNLKMKIDGMLIQGQIDRIDKNNSTGMIRIIDYKTSDQVNNPEGAHLSSLQQDNAPYSIVKGKNRRWKDLQLPLYLLLLSEREDLSGGIELCYFNLPKAVGDVGLSVWEKYTSEITDSARTCAQGIISDIRAWRFWPPKGRVEYDNFEKIFADKALNSVDAAALEDCFYNLRRNQ